MSPPKPELSCYTSNLLAYLAGEVPDASARLAAAVRLSVRTDLPDGYLCFTHHHRVDRCPDGTRLGYRGARDWTAARSGLLAELAARGRVLAVANTRHIRWSPQYGVIDSPHWILLLGRRGGHWQVADRFAAILPHGRQEPYEGLLGDDELRVALTPTPGTAREVALREAHALGVDTGALPAGRITWLAREAGRTDPERIGTWLDDLPGVLEFVRDRFTDDVRVLERHADDMWAASRHHRFRIEAGVRAGTLDGSASKAALASWAALPRSLRFAVESLSHGRERPGMVRNAFDEVLRHTPHPVGSRSS